MNTAFLFTIGMGGEHPAITKARGILQVYDEQRRHSKVADHYATQIEEGIIEFDRAPDASAASTAIEKIIRYAEWLGRFLGL